MIAACPTLKAKFSGAKGRDSNNTITMKTFPGGSLAIVGANSPADLASKPIRYLFLDEIDRFPESAGSEGDPIQLAERRTETFKHNRKIVKCSTPTIKGRSKIERAYMRGTQEQWQTECPSCKSFSFIRFDDVLFDKEEFKDEEGKTDYHVRNARWRCPICQREHREAEVKRFPAKWVAKNPKALQNGIRSFQLNAFMSPWSDWGAIALSFLHAKDDPALLQVFHNTMLGESWELRENHSEPQKLYDRREYYNAEVPTGVLVLTMGVDTQDNRLEYEVVGWDREEQCDAYIAGYRFVPAGQSWMREDGEVFAGEMASPWKDWEALDGVQREYEREQHQELVSQNAELLDAMAAMVEDVYNQDLETIEGE